MFATSIRILIYNLFRRKGVKDKLEEWRRAMEGRRLQISRHKAVYLRFNGDGNLDGNSDINLGGLAGREF